MPDSKPPEVTSYDRGDVRVIVPVGEFDLGNLAAFRDAVLGAVKAGQALVLDLSGTTFVDSTVIAVMVGGQIQASRAGRWLRLVAPPQHILRTLQILALDALLGVYPDIEAALADADRAVQSG